MVLFLFTGSAVGSWQPLWSRNRKRWRRLRQRQTLCVARRRPVINRRCWETARPTGKNEEKATEKKRKIPQKNNTHTHTKYTAECSFLHLYFFFFPLRLPILLYPPPSRLPCFFCYRVFCYWVSFLIAKFSERVYRLISGCTEFHWIVLRFFFKKLSFSKFDSRWLPISSYC